MSLVSLAVIGLAVVLSTFISGVFGLAGGMILLGTLLVFFDVPTAMIMFSVLVVTANIWRAMTWWRYIDWRICAGYLAGATAAFLALWTVAFLPSKAMVYFVLGVLPFMVEALPRHWHPSIQWRGVPVFGGLVTTALQLVAGNGGVFLDIFFQKSTIDRETTVATKEVCRIFGNIGRILYFGTVGGFDASVPFWIVVPLMLLSIGGTLAATQVVNRMTDADFRRWTRWVIFAVGGIYVLRAAWLYWQE